MLNEGMRLHSINYSFTHEVAFVYCENSNSDQIANIVRRIHDNVKLIHVFENIEPCMSDCQEPNAKYKRSMVRTSEKTWKYFTSRIQAILAYDDLLCQECGGNTAIGEDFCNECS